MARKSREGAGASRPLRRPPTNPKSQSSTSWPQVVIVAAGSLAYSNSLFGPFIFDDRLTVLENPHIRQLWNFAAVLTPARELPVAGRPLVNLSLAINYALGGDHVLGYHLVNVGLHLMTALLVFGLIRRTLTLQRAGMAPPSRSVALALAVALLWTVHPLNTEAVDYVTQRTELMMGLFYLLTLYASVRAWQDPRPRAWLAVAISSCAAGMACKESMATAPVMVVLYDTVFLFGSLQQTIRRRWPLYLGLGFSWIVLFILMLPGPRVHSAGFSSGVRPWTYLLNQTLMINHYLYLAIWPRSLVINYGLPMTLTIRQVFPYALAVTSLLALTMYALIRWPALGFLGVWFFFTLAPTSSVVPIATEVGAERRMYLPLIALTVLAVLAVSSIRSLKSWMPILFLTCAAALLAATVTRNREYGSALTLARTTLERHPTDLAHQLLGAELIGAGQDDAAIVQLQHALPGAPRARYALGVELFKLGRTSEAIKELQTFVREQPLLVEAVSARQLLGEAFTSQEQWEDAIEQYQMVLSMNPSDAMRVDIQALLGEALRRAGRYDYAVKLLTEYVSARPRDVNGLTSLGIAFIAQGRLTDAIAAFGRAVELDPDNGRSQQNLANALFDHRELETAAMHAEQAAHLRPNDPDAHDLFARVLAVQGKVSEAQSELERALQIAPNDPQARDDLAKLKRFSQSSVR